MGEVGSTANNYQVLGKLAVGGMAEIFLARGANTTGVERYVVLKRILRDKATDRRFVQMFLEEARLAAQLQHANIAQVYDIGKLGDSYFFTMEYVHGETVRSVLERSHMKGREIPVPVVLSVLAGTASGLQHAHDRIGIGGRPLGIVHRDISPSNLIISYEGIVKVVDFGVAKATTSESETRIGVVKGKAAYMSPEQARSEPLDRRSDLFSLGIVAWEMLTTSRLFIGANDFEIMSAIVRSEVPPPSSVRPSIPPELDALVLKMLAKSRDDRFQCGDDVVEALERVATLMGHQLSAQTLARYIRETFGTRPEPWVSLANNAGLEAVSVTSEPVPLELPPPTTERMLAAPATTESMQVPKAPVTAPRSAVGGDEMDAPTVAVASLRDIAPTNVDVPALVDVLAGVPSLPTPRIGALTPIASSPAPRSRQPSSPAPAMTESPRRPSNPAITDAPRRPSNPAITDAPRYPSNPAITDPPRHPSNPAITEAPRRPSNPALSDAGKGSTLMGVPAASASAPRVQPIPLSPARPQQRLAPPVVIVAPPPQRGRALLLVVVALAIVAAAIAFVVTH